MIKGMLELRKRIKREQPLIHCITNPISIHACANVVLALGARPIMAEHPAEVAQITATAGALMLNLGNITDVRMKSMEISLRTAKENEIPVLLDLVGTACSDLRFHYAKHLMEIGGIAVLKGNMSELLAIAGCPSHSIGVDAGEKDAVTNQIWLSVNRQHMFYQMVIPCCHVLREPAVCRALPAPRILRVKTRFWQGFWQRRLWELRENLRRKNVTDRAAFRQNFWISFMV